MSRRIAILGLATLAACGPTAPDARYVTPWIGSPYELARVAGRPPREATRISAYLAVAIYEAHAADSKSGLTTLSAQLNGLWSMPEPPAGGVDGVVAAASAARAVIAHFDSNGAVRAESLFTAQVTARRREHVAEPLRGNSIQFGQDVAGAVLAWSESDGLSAAQRRAAQRRPPEAVSDADWGTLRTFVARNADECAAPAAPAYSTRPASDFWKMAKESYDSARAASPDAIAIARFWAEDAGSGRSTAARWTGILRTVASGRTVPAPDAVEAFLLATLSMADTEITSRRQKHRELVVTPAAYVKRAINAEWAPLVSPEDPAYPSGPAAVAGAASEVLARAFGDTTAFTDSAESAGRRVAGFGKARDEIATAGVHLGLHYIQSVQQGRWQGQCVAGKVLGRLKTRQ
jgi:hypothetical protein